MQMRRLFTSSTKLYGSSVIKLSIGVVCYCIQILITFQTPPCRRFLGSHGGLSSIREPWSTARRPSSARWRQTTSVWSPARIAIIFGLSVVRPTHTIIELSGRRTHRPCPTSSVQAEVGGRHWHRELTEAGYEGRLRRHPRKPVRHIP